jgi:penicillin-binding protein 1A
VALDPPTGDVLALVGGRDFGDSEFDRATQGLRQAGSAFKPLVYATALAQGLSPATILVDSPLTMPGGDGTPWTPENSDGTWSGPVTMRTALSQSINIPAIRLALAVGIDSVIATARSLGLTTPIPTSAPMAIGAADVQPIELIAAFTAFANLGVYAAPRMVTLVQDRYGIPTYESRPEPRPPALDPRVAFQMTSLLQDAVQRGTGVAVNRAGLPEGLPMAGKTGTSNNNADVWFIGYTPDLVAGVWLGFDRRQTITRGAFGGTLAAPIWGRFAAGLYRQRSVPEPWKVAEGLVAVRVRRSDGAYAPGDTTGATVTEYFLEGTEPTEQAIAQRVLRQLRLWVPRP